jgi:hypothetical protein
MSRTARSFMCVASIVTVFAGSALMAQTASGNACALLTDSELASVLGGKAPLKPGSIGAVQTCSAEGPATSMLLRVFKRSGDPNGEREKAGVEKMKKMGVQIEGKEFADMTCMTIAAPASMPQLGYSTTCTLTKKAPMFAVIEIKAKSQTDMASIDKVRAVAEKMAARF